jgi:DNA-binding NarL/FixJ family response regulator
LTEVLAAAASMPVIVLSGMVDNDFAMELIQLGADEVVVKGSMTGLALVRLVRTALARHHRKLSL